MKKLFVLTALLLSLTFSTFAVDFAVGGKGFFGGNIAEDSQGYKGGISGLGAFFNLDLLAGFGFQFEMNYISNRFSISENSMTIDPYKTLDLPFYVWYQAPLRPLTLGGGAGFNLSFSNLSVVTVEDSSSGDFFNIGLSLAANMILYVNEHFGLLLEGNYVWDFIPSIKKERSGTTTTLTVNEHTYKRQSLYGSLGLQYKF